MFDNVTRERKKFTEVKGPPQAHTAQTRCGHAAFIGSPNSGKSTLFNALIGESLSIITPWAQTTQRSILGILTRESAQVLFLDAPGVMRPRDVLQRSLLAGARAAARAADVVILVVDPLTTSLEEEGPLLVEVATKGAAARIGVVSKMDAAKPEAVERAHKWLEERLGPPVYRVSGLTGHGIEALEEAIISRLPPGPFLYPAEDVATDPVRFFVAERIREAIFEQYRDEIPYASICEVQEFRDGIGGDRTYIQAVVYVEKRSQKGILVGRGGEAIRALGVAARRKIEHFLDRPVYLDLWVKVLPAWRKKPAHLRRFGLSDPDDDGLDEP